jgi:hypothetical protein
MSNLETVKSRIRKLLNLAGDDAAADGEIDNALAAARRLMLEHSINEADVKTAEEAYAALDRFDASSIEYGTTSVDATKRALSAWESTLTHVITGLVGTVKCYTNRSHKTAHGTVRLDRNGRGFAQSTIVFYGPAEDARDAAELFREWSETILALGVLKHGGSHRGAGRSYCGGFAAGMLAKVTTTLRAERADVDRLHAATDTSTALVVLQNALEIQSQKRDAAAKWLRAEKGIHLSSRGGSRSGYSAGGYSAGFADGQRSNPTRTRAPKLTR